MGKIGQKISAKRPLNVVQVLFAKKQQQKRSKMEMLVELYCSVDDFWKDFNKQWEQHLITKGKSSRGPKAEMSIPEMMTISILFHQSNHRNFKHFYCNHVMVYLRQEFPVLISYSRFVYLCLFKFEVQQ